MHHQLVTAARRHPGQGKFAPSPTPWHGTYQYIPSTPEPH